MGKIFIGVTMVAVLFLSGCNLNTGTTAPAPSTVPPVPPTSSAPEAMEKDDEVMAKATSYQAGTIQAFDQQAFDAALADGKTIFLDFYAPWCPTCRANEPLVDVAFDGTDVVAFRADYDTVTDLRKTYSVTYQSTYIVFKNGQEVGRYTGSLTDARIQSLLDS